MPQIEKGSKPLLELSRLSVAFRGVGEVVKQVDLRISAGETVGIVGESGSGKSMLARAIMRLLSPQARITGGQIRFHGQDTYSMKEADFRRMRGSGIGMVFQEPMTSLNPSLRIGTQIAEGLRQQGTYDEREIGRRIRDMLERVRIANPESCLRKYPHEFSGGMRQRIMLASVLLMQPDLLIADEPTTALDAVIQKQVLDIMAEITRDLGTAVMLISHDLGVVGSYVERLSVMRHGEVVEAGSTEQVLLKPRHPYTISLIEALPSRDKAWRQVRPAESGAPLVDVHNVCVTYGRRSTFPWIAEDRTQALKGVSLRIDPGETVAVVGESGSGKTTLGRAILRLIDNVDGEVRVAGQDVFALSGDQLRAWRKTMQIIFQDPYSALDPRRRIYEIVSEGLRHFADVPRSDYRRRAEAALEEVDLGSAYLDRYPHELSGGQRQRISIARALIMKPKLVVADEPVSALDITVQAKILELMKRLQADHGFAYLFISHDLGVVEQVADRVVVMHAGRIVEQGRREMIFDRPLHPYTRLLLQAVPDLRRQKNGAYKIETRSFSESTPVNGWAFNWPDNGMAASTSPGARLVEIEPEHFALCRPSSDQSQEISLKTKDA